MRTPRAGDGLYASFDGWQIRLRAPREDGDHEVYLEPDVLRAFETFAANICGNSQPTTRKSRGDKQREAE